MEAAELFSSAGCCARILLLHDPMCGCPRLSHTVSALHAGLTGRTLNSLSATMPNVVDTSMLPVDICHLKQTVLIRPSTKSKYQPGQPRRIGRKHSTRVGIRGLFHLYGPDPRPPVHTVPNVAWILPGMRQYRKHTLTKGLSIASFVGGFLKAYTLLLWRLAKGSSDECEPAATDVHAQFLGMNLSLLKNCVWTISR